MVSAEEEKGSCHRRHPTNQPPSYDGFLPEAASAGNLRYPKRRREESSSRLSKLGEGEKR